MNKEHEFAQPSTDVGNEAASPRRMSRREALAIVGKHAVYTAPAVLAVLAVTKSNQAHASDCSGPGCEQP